MLNNKKANNILIKIAGVLILGRGLFHIIFMGKYIDYAMSKFFKDLPFETLFVIGTSIFPFLEFFIGLLLLFKVKLKNTLLYSMLIYLTLIIFTIIEAYYQQTVYLLLVLFILVYIYLNSRKEVVKQFI